MRFEFQMEAYCATQAQRDGLQSLAQNYLGSNRVDFTADPVINQHLGSMYADPMVFVEAHGTTRLGLDRMFDAVVTELQRPNRGVDATRSYMWIKEVDDSGAVIANRSWP